MTKMNRRDFLRSVGIGSTATAAACSTDPIGWDPLVPIERAYPYVVQPEQVVPGVATYFNTRCGHSGNSIQAKVREGRAIMLEGNQNDKASLGKVAGIGLANLQESYSPDRFKGPQIGEATVSIDKVVDTIAAQVKSAGSKVAWIGRPRQGASAEIVDHFISAVGGEKRYWDENSNESLISATKEFFGLTSNAIPSYHLENAKNILGFGADFLCSWGDVTTKKGWADSRTPETHGAEISKTVTFGPRIGLTNSNADKHFNTKPGTEVGVALAIAKLMIPKYHYEGPLKGLVEQVDAEKNIKEAGGDYKAVESMVNWLYSPTKAHGKIEVVENPEAGTRILVKINNESYTVTAGSDATATRDAILNAIKNQPSTLVDVSEDGTSAIDLSAKVYGSAGNHAYEIKTSKGSITTEHDTMKGGNDNKTVVLPGGPETSSNPHGLALATLIINEVCGAFTESDKPVISIGLKNVDNYASAKEIVDLVERCGKGEFDVLFIDDLNLAFEIPSKNGVGLKQTLEKIKTTVFFNNEPRDSITSKSIVVPPGTALERWTDGETIYGNRVLGQPVMNPQNSIITLSPEDLLLKIAQKNGLKSKTEAETPLSGPSLAEEKFAYFLKKWWHNTLNKGESELQFNRSWINYLKQGGSFQPKSSGENVTVNTALKVPSNSVKSHEGMHLVVFPHPHIGTGRGANISWLQEIPDPISGFSWGTWIEVNPKTAESLGLVKNKGAEISNSKGTLKVGWFGSPGVAEGTIAVVMGNGHKNGGRYAREGVNPLELFEQAFDASGALAYGSTDITVSKSEGRNAPNPKNNLLKSDTLSRNGRYVNHTSSIHDWKDVKKHSIVPEHHLPESSMAMRARKTKSRYVTINPKTGKPHQAMLTDMYPEPEHPTYRFVMAIDLNRCTGCGSCEAACYAENNIPVVGPEEIRKGRSMSWVRLSRYWEPTEGNDVDIRFQPVMCQQCSHAPCEGVCPVLATYHNLDGLNAMIYNRCVGTRYCGNNCPYSARRFNYHTYRWPESYNLMLNPDVLTREMGVMEKCTFCIQRIRDFKDEKRTKYGMKASQNIQSDDHKKLAKLLPCASSCPSECMSFGNEKDELYGSDFLKHYNSNRGFAMLGELNTKPAVRYLTRMVHTKSHLHHGGGHGDHGDGHADAHHDTKADHSHSNGHGSGH